MRSESPDWRAEIRVRLASARLHPQDEAELVEEVGQHLEEQYGELAPRIGAEAARERLLDQLGDQTFDDAIARRRKRARPTLTRTWSSTSVLHDIRYGVRSLRRSPGTVVAGVVALALGIGLTTVMYSVIYGLLIKGLPFENADRIAMVPHGNPSQQDDRAPLGSFARYQRQQRSFEAFGAFTFEAVNVSGGDRPERVTAARMTPGAFEATGVRAMLGRTFIPTDGEPGTAGTVVLGYATWRDGFNSDSAVVGRQLRVNGAPHTIVGVMPEQFEFPRETRVWLPLATDAATLRPWEGSMLSLVGRLRPNVTYEQASAEFGAMSQQLSLDRPPETPEQRAHVLPFVRATIPDRIYSIFNGMLAAVLLVLLVACANVANLLLDRTVGRTREIGIRTALGASRLAVVRQSLVESAILAVLAAIIGTAIAHVGIVLFNQQIVQIEHPFWMDIRLHPPVLVFVLAIALLASLVSGLLPAMQAARLDISAILKDESHAASSLRVGRLSKMIVALEIAISATLLVGTGFLTKSIVKMRTIEPGFASADVYTASVVSTSPDPVRRRRFLEALERELAATPGAAAVYVGSGLPATGLNMDRVAIAGRAYAREQDYPSTRSLTVSPGFFSTFGVRVLRGRAITPTDVAGSTPVAVVSQEFVRRYLAGADPIGQRIRLGGAESEREWLTIVGVIPTLYTSSFGGQDRWPPQVLTAFWQERDLASAYVAVRGSAEVAGATSIRKVVGALDPEVPVNLARSMDDALNEDTWGLRVFGTMFIIFGIVALVLAAIGLYAVMSFSVSRRVREMGIRMALGASGGDVIRMVCRQGARQILFGISLGFVAGAAVVRVARVALFEVQPNDPMVFAVVAGVLGVAAFVACIIPAIAATRVDPLIALRTD